MDQFDRLAAAFADRAGVTIGESRGFGSGTLRAGGRIFAMRNAAGVALKLPATRVTALLASGGGLPFDAGKGRPMKEWVVIPRQSDAEWLALAKEALAFVASSRKT